MLWEIFGDSRQVMPNLGVHFLLRVDHRQDGGTNLLSNAPKMKLLFCLELTVLLISPIFGLTRLSHSNGQRFLRHPKLAAHTMVLTLMIET